MPEDQFEMVNVVSTRVSQLGYNKETSQMRALFPNGRLYQYEGVSEEVFNEVLTSGSVGKAFGDLIVHGPYSYRQI